MKISAFILVVFLFLSCNNEVLEAEPLMEELEKLSFSDVNFPSVAKDSNVSEFKKINSQEQLQSKGDVIYKTTYEPFNDIEKVIELNDSSDFAILVDTNQSYGRNVGVSWGLISDSVMGEISEPRKFFTVFLVNLIDDNRNVSTQDGRIVMIQEALDTNGNWQPIEYWQKPSCGNSYYNYEISRLGYFLIGAIKYTGDTRTICRIKALINDKFYYSNEFYNYINQGQFERKSDSFNYYLEKK